MSEPDLTDATDMPEMPELPDTPDVTDTPAAPLAPHDPIVVTAADIARSEEGLDELRQARRANHRARVHWIDALYKAYMTALGAVGAVVLGSGYFPDDRLAPDAAQRFFEQGPRWLGLGAAVAVAIGLRTGSRGGPLAIEAATVQHELMAPVPRRIALRGPVRHHLRFATFAGGVVGGVVGMLVSHRVAPHAALVVTSCIVAFAAMSLLANSVAIAACGRRLGKIPANLLALGVISWVGVDIAAGVSTSPFTGIASVAFLPMGFTPVLVAGVALTVLAFVAALAGLEHLSLERARERAGLVAQLRFAATMQDVRTVVLLRRQLSQERARGKPWIRLGPGRAGKKPGRVPTWRRDWQCYLRFPATRLLRMVSLSMVAGLALGFTWRGAYPAFLVAGLALFLAAYDTVEPIAQEVDHPTRWDALAGDEGKLLLAHLWAALTLMLILVSIAGATSLILVPASVVGTLFPPMFLSVAGAAVTGAALSTTMGSSGAGSSLTPSGGGDAMGMDMMGMVTVLRMVIPPAIPVGTIAPLMAVGVDAAHLNTVAMSNYTMWPFVAIFLALLFIRYRKPSRV